MPISPWTIGQLSPIWTVVLMRQILQSDGTLTNKPMDLTGVSTGQITMLVYNASKVLTITGTGTVAIVDAVPGIITYQLVSTDIPTTPSTYYIKFKVNYNGTTPDYSSYITWVVEN